MHARRVVRPRPRSRTIALTAVVLLAACGGGGPSKGPATLGTESFAAASGSGRPATPRAPLTTKRSVLSLGRTCGTSVTTVSPDGTLSVSLDVLENGRGPHTEATFRLAPDGTIARYEAHGRRGMGTAVDETFARRGNHARWKGTEEQGERELASPAFFVPLAELPETLGLLVQALRRHGGTLPLLPAGEARLERTGDATVRVGAKELHLVGHAITGLQLAPTRVWMHDDGSFFGVVSPWWSVVPEGYESVVDPLIAQQHALDVERDRALATKLTVARDATFLHARVLDVERGAWLADQTVVTAGGVITWVGPSGKAPPRAGSPIVDLQGKALLPGLWDMHSHLADAEGLMYVASGVTTVRDVGNDPDTLDDWKRRYDDGSAIGPHVVRFGFIEGRNEKAASSAVTAENATEARAAVELFAKRGYEGIKIYNSVKPELVPLLTKHAHAKRMMVTGHVPVHMLAHEAVRAGYDGIEHANMLFLNFLADHDTDTRTTTRFTLVGDEGAALDLRSERVGDFVALLKQRRTVVDPTLGIFEDLLCSEQGKVLPGLETLAARLPATTQRQFLQGGLPADGEKRATYLASFEKMLAMTKLLHDEKVPLVVGTDGLAGLMVHRELGLFVRAGISPIDALRAATIEPARLMKKGTVSGSIAVGKQADMFVVDGDPLAHIEDVAKVTTTIRGGVVYDARALFGTVGVR
jgi:hypothetical protein